MTVRMERGLPAAFTTSKGFWKFWVATGKSCPGRSGIARRRRRRLRRRGRSRSDRASTAVDAGTSRGAANCRGRRWPKRPTPGVPNGPSHRMPSRLPWRRGQTWRPARRPSDILGISSRWRPQLCSDVARSGDRRSLVVRWRRRNPGSHFVARRGQQAQKLGARPVPREARDVVESVALHLQTTSGLVRERDEVVGQGRRVA